MALTKVSRGLLSTSIVDNGNATAITIDSSENVGIGNSSPVTLKSATTLQVSGNAKLGNDNGRGLLSLGDISSTGANVGIWRGAAGAYAGVGNYLNLGGYDGITFTTGAADIASQTERMRITSSGDILGKTADVRIGSDVGSVEYGTSTTNSVRFYSSDTERMRITSSGNLLVGTTDDVVWNNNANSAADNGHNLRDDGRAGFAYYNATANSNATVNINRTGSDGDLIRLFKSGSNVGSIGAAAGNLYIVSNDVGLNFAGGNDGIFPATANGAQRDAAIDLGASSHRFKDLYLSGKVQASYIYRADASGAGLHFTTNAIYPTNETTALSDGNESLGAAAYRFKDLYLSGKANTGSITTDNANTQFNKISRTGAPALYVQQGDNTNDILQLRAGNGQAGTGSQYVTVTGAGNLLVGKTAVDNTSAGFRVDGSSGFSSFVRDGGEPLYLNRKTSDGDILKFAKNNSTVGSIGTTGGGLNISTSSTGRLQVSGGDVFKWDSNQFYPHVDNARDLGFSTFRWDDIYATNGTIQTSDRNEKQDIAELSDAEQRVAVAAKGLLRKFRWKDSVAEKDDEARTHFGIIAQDLQAAFAAEGLDAGDYAMFISSTWTDEETNEEKTRMGVRYSELLAFIIAAI